MTEPGASIQFEVNGTQVEIVDDGRNLLEVLRDDLGHVEVKDGCSPQGQCGCCTVLVDGAPRVSCVTPARRVKGRSIRTIDGLDPERRELWGEAMCATGGSQCGFCTPGIICRLEGASEKGADLTDRAAVDKALLGHLCRCTGWQPIREAAAMVASPSALPSAARDLDGARIRAQLEGRAQQLVGPEVALGRSGFADDLARRDALVALPSGGSWIVADSIGEARAAIGKIQGRRTSVVASPPIEAPEGEWDVTLRTCWVEPAYLEPDAVYCEPGGDPIGPLTNGGAFGGKVDSGLAGAARRLADEHGRPVRVLLDREDVVRFGPKRPPLAVGMNADMSGVLRVASTPGVDELVSQFGGSIQIERVELAGPPTSVALRGAIRAELEMVRAAVLNNPEPTVTFGSGAWARARVEQDLVSLVVSAGRLLDPVVLRTYVIGAAHQALGMVRSEALAVDPDGQVHDLTIRSFGVLRAVDTPQFEVELVDSDDEPSAVSEAVFCAVAAAAWIHEGRPPTVPLTAEA